MVAAVIPMVIGMVWYGPMLFMDSWMRLSGKTKKDMEDMKGQMFKIYGISYVCFLLLSVVTSLVVGQFNAQSIFAGAQIGFILWLGYIATVLMINTLYNRESMTLYSIDAGFYLINLILIGSLLAVWR